MSEMANWQLVRPLQDLTARHNPQVGSKAANLGELFRAGFPVPDGLVLTVEAFRRFLAANQIDPDGAFIPIPATAEVPAELAEEIASMAADLGDTELAVRSSAPAEDTPEASFAGQYETILGVRGQDGLLQAVRQVWISAGNPQAASYRAAHDIPFTGMAVLVQRQIPAEAAGVAHSADPVTGDRSVTRVNAGRGLGERPVSGETSPDEWTVKAEDARCLRAPEGVLDAAGAREIASLARRAEDYWGCPQAIEWAQADETLYVLPSRPITTAVPKLGARVSRRRSRARAPGIRASKDKGRPTRCIARRQTRESRAEILLTTAGEGDLPPNRTAMAERLPSLCAGPSQHLSAEARVSRAGTLGFGRSPYAAEPWGYRRFLAQPFKRIFDRKLLKV
ncbi:MAG: hypothetical protein M0Z53_14405 [Thermaerobacter sp.]|nr:hypothetical protein [Thermaerobacter sp.]